MLEWAQQIIKNSGFLKPELIYGAKQYTGDVRNLIYCGLFKGKPAVLKIYHEPRRVSEASSLEYFNRANKSKKLIAPEVFESHEETPFKGWYIMEKFPEDAYSLAEKHYPNSMDSQTRQEFIDIFLEYQKHFPKKSFRPLLISEKLPADEFHIIRIHRWFEMANEKEIESQLKGNETVLNTKIFFPLYFRAQELIKKEFKNRRMIWSHGHFKPKEIFYSPSKNIYYLTDFAHTYFYPEGYELGFIIWSDWLMTGDWKLPYAEWEKGVGSWIKDLVPVAKKLKYKNPERLIKASLVERILGTILADVTASDKLREEKLARLNYLFKLLKELL